MDKRNSKESLLSRIRELEKDIKRLEAVYDAGCWGIAHVGQANYQSRCYEAQNRLNHAMYYDDEYDETYEY